MAETSQEPQLGEHSVHEVAHVLLRGGGGKQPLKSVFSRVFRGVECRDIMGKICDQRNKQM